MTKKNKNEKESNSGSLSSSLEEEDDDTKEKTTKKQSITTTESPNKKKKSEEDESDEITDSDKADGDEDKVHSLVQSGRRKKIVQNSKVRSNRKFIKNAIRKQKKAKLLLSSSTTSTTSTTTSSPLDNYLKNHLVFDLNKKFLPRNPRPFENAFTDLLEPNVHYNHPANGNQANLARFGTRLNFGGVN